LRSVGDRRSPASFVTASEAYNMRTRIRESCAAIDPTDPVTPAAVSLGMIGVTFPRPV